MGIFKTFLETVSPMWYHVTYAKNIPSIARHGLIRNARPNWNRGQYNIHSQQGIFVTTPKNVRYWVERFENLAEHNSDDIYKDGLVPIILRFSTLGDTREDNMLTTGDMIYERKRILPEIIEMWTGREWRKELTLTGVKVSDFLTKYKGNVYFKERYPFPPEL